MKKSKISNREEMMNLDMMRGAKSKSVKIFKKKMMNILLNLIKKIMKSEPII